jgi:predicted permease
VLNDLRLAARALRRAPAFALATALTLALGMGATTALFAAVRGVLLRPLPYPRPEQLVRVREVAPGGGALAFADPNFDDLRRGARAFSALAAYRGAPVVVTGGAEAARVPSAVVTRDFFAVMGVRPAAGRAFVGDELQQGGAQAVVVSDGFWRRALGGARDFAARPLVVDGQPYAVVGVMPPGFGFPDGTEIWRSRELYPMGTSRTAHNLAVVGRLRDGATAAAAQGEASALVRALKRAYGSDMRAVDVAVEPLRDAVVGRARTPILLLFAAAGVLLLVAAANVTTLLLARGAARRRELGVRVAVGATRARLLRPMLAEAAVLAGAGAVGGVAVAAAGARALAAAAPAALPRAGEVRVDLPVLGFALAGAAVLAAALGGTTGLRAAGLALAARGGAVAGGERAGTEGRAGARARAWLVSSQVALTAVLLVGAGLLGRSFLSLTAVDPGFRTEGAAVVSVTFPRVDDGDRVGPARQRQAADAIVARLRALPGVRAAGAVTSLPVLGGNDGSGTYLVQTRPDEVRDMDDFARLSKDPTRAGQASYRKATDGYFEAMRIPLLRGRLFTAADGPDAPPVAVISASVARQSFGDREPLGRLIQFGNMDGDTRPLTVVGVVGDVRENGLAADPEPTVYSLARQRPPSTGLVAVLAGGPGFDAAATMAAASRAVRAVDPGLPVRTRRIEEVFERAVADRRYALVLAGAFGAAALALAAAGLYGVVAYVAAQRRRELGVRVALGARAGDVRRLVLGRGLAPAALGLGAGLAGALAAGRLLAAHLYGVRPGDPATFAGVALALGAVAFAAAWAPARRAARVDPASVLRAE